MPQNPSPGNPARVTMSPQASSSAASDAQSPVSPSTSTTSSSVTNTSVTNTLLEQHLVKVTADIVAATNARNWDRTTYPWNHIAQNEFTVGNTYAQLPTEVGFDGFLQGFSKIYAERPNYYIRPTEITANLTEKTGKATVYLHMENVNFSPGVIRHSIGKLDFVGRGNGFWQVVRYASFPIGEGVPE